MEIDEQPQGSNVQSKVQLTENPSKIQNDCLSENAQYFQDNGLEWCDGQLLDENGNPITVDIEQDVPQNQSKFFIYYFFSI